jgi:hypothetical protein
VDDTSIFVTGRNHCALKHKFVDTLSLIVNWFIANKFVLNIIKTNVINEELHNLYTSPSIIRMIKSRRMRWAGHVARMDEKWNAKRILVGKPEGKRSLGRPRRRWVDNIKMDHR